MNTVMDWRGCGICVWPQAAPLMGHGLTGRLHWVSLEDISNLCDTLILSIKSYRPLSAFCLLILLLV